MLRLQLDDTHYILWVSQSDGLTNEFCTGN
jgi:hypothetical protein